MRFMYYIINVKYVNLLWNTITYIVCISLLKNIPFQLLLY